MAVVPMVLLIARANAEYFLRRVLALMPDFEVIEEQVQRCESIPLANGYVSMPMRFTPRQRVSLDDDAYPNFTAARILPVRD